MSHDFTKEEINFIKKNVKTFILKKNTIIYRAQSSKYDYKYIPKYDNDTGKFGMYFSNSIYIPYGHVIEYNENLNLYSYKITKDIKLYIGKYSFRNFEPNRFYKNFSDWKEKKIIPNIEPTKKIYWNHYDNKAYPIIDVFHKNYNYWNKKNIAEIFISDKKLIKFNSNLGKIEVNKAKKILNNLINAKKNN